MNQSCGCSSVLGFFIASLFVAACSGGDSGTSNSIIDSCQGAYTCIIESRVVDSRLTKTNAGRCYLGNLELDPNGTSTPVDGQATTWSGDANRIDICQGPRCFSCYPSRAASGSAAPESPSAGSGASGPSAGSGAPGPSAGGGASGPAAGSGASGPAAAGGASGPAAAGGASGPSSAGGASGPSSAGGASGPAAAGGASGPSSAGGAS